MVLGRCGCLVQKLHWLLQLLQPPPDATWAELAATAAISSIAAIAAACPPRVFCWRVSFSMSPFECQNYRFMLRLHFLLCHLRKGGELPFLPFLKAPFPPPLFFPP